MAPGEVGRRYAALACLVGRARVARGMTQRQLSRALGMSEGYVGHLERGRIRPSIQTLKALGPALGLLYGELAVAAGYITRDEFEAPIDDRQLARLTEMGDLTNEEWDSVRDFARYVRSRRGS
jgi:transcriptional regulator with XRE-family HTH domain